MTDNKKRAKRNTKKAKLDQTVTEMAVFMSSLLWQLYNELKKQGFTKDQAMKLVAVHLDNLTEF